MSLRPEILQPAPVDLGSAMSIADLTRRLATLEGQYGVFGDNMRVTGATIETSDPSNVGSGRVYIDSTTTPEGLFVEDTAGHTILELVGGGTPGITTYDDSGNTSFVLQGGSGTIFYMNDPTFGITVWIVPQGGLGLLAGTGSGNTVSWHQNLLLGMDSFVQGYRIGNSNAWHAHAATPNGAGGTDLTLYADDFGSANALELWSGPGTNTRILWITPSGAGTVASDWNVKGTCFITGAMSAIGNSVCWNNLNVNGTCTMGAQLITSDEGLKEEIQPLPPGHTSLHELQVFSYRHKQLGRRQIGLVAQDVQAAIPEAVVATAPPRLPEDEEEPETTLGIDMYMILSLLVAEVQQLHRRLTAMEE